MARASPSPYDHPTDRLVGHSSALNALRLQVRHLATFDTLGNPHAPTVLLYGETGTGKGLIARILHDSGPRAAGPFLEVNCAAIPETLLEAELFGFEAGTFTDARRAKPGLWEAASGGTLFLDEVAELPLPLQSKLLKVIEDKRVRRLGAVTERVVDVKLTAATQAELSTVVQNGRFRADLYHRLSVVLLTVPPLRERREDIHGLAQLFLAQYEAAHGLHPRRLSTAAEAWLQGYDWPGNVSELSHLMERVTLFSQETIVAPSTLEELCLPRLPSANHRESGPDRNAFEAGDERARLVEALRHTGGNVVQAARLLGLSRAAIRHRLSRYGITHPRVAPRPQSAALGDQAGSSLAEALSLEAIREPSPVSAPNWEQKPVAVLAIEMTWPAIAVGDASLYEPWTVTRHWKQTMVEKAQVFGGVVLPHLPSLVLAVFGVPLMLEQAPQRAIQAALAVRRLVTEAAEGGPYPELRMAIHWGQVLVDSGASDPMAHLPPIGDTLARPGRLLGYTGPGELLASAEMGQLVGGWCELRARETLLGIGQSDDLAAYTVVGMRPLGSSLEMHRQRPLSRFVGRERELAALENLLGHSREGRGQVVGGVGEAGIGKSRLCYEFMRGHLNQGGLILETNADASGQAIPYLPIIELLKSYFQIASRDDVATRRAKVTDKLHTLGQSLASSLPAVLTLLDVPVDDAAWLALDPPQRRQRLQDAIKRLLVLESQAQPILLVAKNLHWIDGETQALLDTLVESLPTACLLLLVSYRPEYQHGWGSKTYYTQLRLDPLPREHAQTLLDALLGDDASLDPLRQSLWQRTAGNPFFLEESVQTLIETQVLVGARGAYQLAKPLPSVQVPATVQAVLAARIDRLSPQEKRLLQVAAVIGMEVPFALVQAVAELSEAELRHTLARLQATEFLYEASLFPDLTHTFKHVLTHGVAYDSLLRRRRDLHARIVDALEGLYPGRLAEQVDRLAHHALRGEVWDKALRYYQQAGAVAEMRSAYREAVACFEQALGALQHLPESRDTIEQAIDLRFDLRNMLFQLGDHGPLLEHLRQAETLAQALGDQRRLGWVYSYMSRQFRQIPDYDRAISSGERALAIAAALGDFPLQVATHSFLGQTYYFLGNYRWALDILRRNMASLQGDLLGEHFGGGVATFLHSCTWLVTSLAELGAFTEGVAHGEEQARIAESIDQPEKVVPANFATGLLYLRKGDLNKAIALLERGHGLCQVWNLGGWSRVLPSHLGYAYALAGRVAEAVPLLEQALGPDVPITGADALCMAYLCEAYLLAGRREEAIQFAGRALALSSERNLRGQQAWVLRLLGEIGAQRHPPEVEQAEDHYRQALALAEELGMSPLQAHCHLALGTLYGKVGRRAPARAELSIAIDLYRAMDMTFWLPQAEVALAQVG
jgi:DNA-binding NtrC family response regulator/tetratricopeptide (TPR) repeat protein